MIGSNKKEGWSECFQDLGKWCPLAQDELHTPKINIQDEFNFSIDDGRANDWDLMSSPVDMQNDLWGNDTQFGLSPIQPIIGDINNTFVQERAPLSVINNKKPNYLGSSGGKVICSPDSNKSPLKSKGNVLLSQGIVKTASDDSTLLSITAAFDNKTNNPIFITNDYLLPITVPEYASAKLNSSTCLTTPILQSSFSPTPSPLITTKEVLIKEDKKPNALSQQILPLEKISIKNGLKMENIEVLIGNNNNNNNIEIIETSKILRREKSKPALKLNIAAASSAGRVGNFSSPEVLKPLVEGDSKEFNLLQYVCNDGEYSGLSQEVEQDEDRKSGDNAIRDHDYIDSWSSLDLKSDLMIKSEPGSPVYSTYSASNASTNKERSKRKRRRDSSGSDFVVSDSELSLSDDDSQQDWSPTPSKKRTKRKTSINSTKSNKIAAGRRRRRRSSGTRRNDNNSGNSQIDELSPGQDKYRALRERNNEASRRSRMNRKQRDVEMLQQAEELQKKNVYLKARAEKMENLVKYMRSEIMKAITKRK